MLLFVVCVGVVVGGGVVGSVFVVCDVVLMSLSFCCVVGVGVSGVVVGCVVCVGVAVAACVFVVKEWVVVDDDDGTVVVVIRVCGCVHGVVVGVAGTTTTAT